MNEIEKMYENVKLTNLYCGDDYVAEYMLEFECTDGDKEKCKTCDKAKISYPPFTAEKQIKLIKLLGNVRDYTVEIDKFKGVYYVGCRSAGSNDKLWGSSNTFEDALAELINETWFCLTEEERKQIKEILE